MKFDIDIQDWGEHVITYMATDLDEAMSLILEASLKHPGAHVNVCIEDECVLMDMALSPDVEANLLKLERKILKRKQKESAEKTNKILKEKNPNHYRDAARARWSKNKE